MGGNGPGDLRRADSLPAMRLVKHRVSADDSEIHDPRGGRYSLRAKNYPQGILLSGLPLYLEQRGGTYYRSALASFLSRPRGGAGLRLACSDNKADGNSLPARLVSCIHEVAHSVAAGVGYLWRCRMVRLQRVHQGRNRS